MSYPMSFIISKRKETIVKRLTAAIILGLASLLIAPYPAVAQSPETTASEVVDQETLKAFVEEARAWSETITDPNDVAPLYCHYQCRGGLEAREHISHPHAAKWHRVLSRR